MTRLLSIAYRESEVFPYLLYLPWDSCFKDFPIWILGDTIMQDLCHTSGLLIEMKKIV